MSDPITIGFFFLWSALYLTVLAFVLQRRGLGDRQTRLLSFYLAAWFIANVTRAISGMVGWTPGEYAPEIGLAVTTVILVNQVRWALSTRTPAGDRFWWAIGLLWFAGVVATQLAAPQFSFWVLLAGWIFFLGRAILLWVRIFRKTVALARRQLLYWALILGLSLIGGLLHLTGYELWGNLPAWLGAILLGFVLAIPQMPDFLRVLGQFVGALILTVAAMVLYALTWSILALIGGSQLPIATPWLAGLVVAALLALAFIPLWALFQRWLGRLFPISHYDVIHIMREYSLSVSNILDPQRLATAAIGLISEAIEVQRGVLLLVYREQVGDSNTYRLTGTTGMGIQTPSDGVIDGIGTLAQFFTQERKPLYQYDLDFSPRFGQLPANEQTWFADLHMDLYVPIYAKDEWIGLLALGSKAMGEPYTENDLILLRILADQTAVALQNARLVESLMRVNNDFRRAYSALEQSNRQLGRVNTQLGKLDRAKSDFIAIASHELRTPLTVMRGYTEMLLDDPMVTGNDYYKKLVNGIHSGIMRFHEIVDGMLDIAMIDNSTLNLNVGDVSMEVLIRLIVNSLKDAVTERGLALTTQNLQGLPPIAGDPEALRKVFFHLIINAVKYTPDGGSITISGRHVPRGQGMLPSDAVEIVVSDTGIGIDPEYHDLIFAKFYQTGEIALHSTGKTKFKGGGPGLGLTIAKGIIEAHGGRIWVESPGYDEDKCPGSRFFVLLPLRHGKGGTL